MSCVVQSGTVVCLLTSHHKGVMPSDDWGKSERKLPAGGSGHAELMDNVRRVERLGFDAIWSGDHIIMHSPSWMS